MNRKWKLYGWSQNNENYDQFYYSDFSHLKNAINFFGYDFFYKENYMFTDSETGNCYEMWNCRLKPGDVILDLGANVGLFTRRAAEIGSIVIAVEGSPEIYSCLVENTYDLQNVHCINAIIEPELNSSGIKHWTSKINPFKIDIKWIMETFNLDHIDFIKCDIEGAEWGLLRNTSFDILSKIDKIALEVHEDVSGENPLNFFIPGKIRHDFTANNTLIFYYVS